MMFSECRTKNQLHVCFCNGNAKCQSAHSFPDSLLGMHMASTSCLVFECLSCSGMLELGVFFHQSMQEPLCRTVFSFLPFPPHYCDGL